MTSLLGIPEIDPEKSFNEIFEEVFAPRLAHREEGFRTIFNNTRPFSPTIVETGCLRALNNWAGDGQSTFMFDWFAKKYGGMLYSIDFNTESIATARKVCNLARLIQGDGTKEINLLVRVNEITRVDLLYLDSFDAFRDVSKIPAPVHYMLEFCAAWPVIMSGSLIAVDDFHNAETPGIHPGTKGLGVSLFLEKIGAEVLHDSYQKIWRIP